jgi:hypothetical protein
MHNCTTSLLADSQLQNKSAGRFRTALEFFSQIWNCTTDVLSGACGF